MSENIKVLVGTRKGAWTLKGNSDRNQWQVEGPLHLGPSIFLSKNGGETWTEATTPPQFPQTDDDSGRSVDHTFWLTTGHSSQPDCWYAGTSPQGLFKSEDGGDNWNEVEGLNNHADFFDWRGNDKDGTPDGPKLHSVIVGALSGG